MTTRYHGSGRPWLLYGAYGFTGRLLVEEALVRGHRPILAGRNRARLEALRDVCLHAHTSKHAHTNNDEGAARGGIPEPLEIRVFPLEGPELVRGLEGVSAVLHAAGPFLDTGVPMMEACLEAGAHYLDITGEVPVFEAAFARGERARERGVVLLPGVGFDVIPTDGIAALLAHAVPGAHRLDLALHSPHRSSTGTLQTVVEGIPGGLLVRRGGELQRAWPGARSFRREVDFGMPGPGSGDAPCPRPGGVQSVAPYTWGDLSTAWRTTGIPEITCYMATPRREVRLLPWILPVASTLLRIAPLRKWIRRRVARDAGGPDPETRAHGRTRAWGRVERDPASLGAGAAPARHASSAPSATPLSSAPRAPEEASGAPWAEVVLEFPEAYRFTAEAGIRALEAVLRETEEGRLTGGALTPAGAFGREWVLELPGVEVVEWRGTGGPPGDG